MHKWWTSFVTITVANACFYTSLYLLLSTMPLLARHLGGSGSFGSSLVAVTMLTAFAVRPLCSVIVDRGDRIGAMLTGLGLVGAAGLTYLTLPLPWVMAAALFLGTGFGLASVAAQAIMADVVPPTRLGESIGYFGMVLTVSMAAGPTVGLALAAAGRFDGVAGLAGLLSVLSALLALVLRGRLGYGRGHTRPPAFHLRQAATDEATRLTGVLRRGWQASLPLFLLTITYGGLVAQLPLFVADRPIGTAAPFFTAYPFVLMVARTLSGRACDRYGHAALILPGLALATAALGLIGGAGSPMELGVWAALYGTGVGLVISPVQSLCFILAGPQNRGAAAALSNMAFDGGMGTGAFVLGMAATVGYPWMFGTAMSSTILAGLFFAVWWQRDGAGATARARFPQVVADIGGR